jgi:hypothetical protein
MSKYPRFLNCSAVNFTIHPGNMEYQRGRNGGWMAIGIPPDGCGLDEEPFQVGNMLIDMIAETQQADNITMVRMDDGGGGGGGGSRG